MTEKTILLVKDNPQDEMRALRRASVSNIVDVARDSLPRQSGLAHQSTVAGALKPPWIAR